LSMSSSSSSSSSPSASTKGQIKGKNWFPLESSPELLNKYISTLGVSLSQCSFHDVYGVDDDLLSMVPSPVFAVLLLFPHSESQIEFSKKEQNLLEIAQNQQKEKGIRIEIDEENKSQNEIKNSIFHIKQSIGNACGTIGILHSILNNVEDLSLDQHKFLYQFYQKGKNKNFIERGQLLEDSDDIEESHQAVAAEGKSDINHEINENLHFICFTHKLGFLWELDGMKTQPICHGPCDKDNVLTNSIRIIKEFMVRDPEDVRFNITALGPGIDED